MSQNKPGFNLSDPFLIGNGTCRVPRWGCIFDPAAFPQNKVKPVSTAGRSHTALIRWLSALMALSSSLGPGLHGLLTSACVKMLLSLLRIKSFVVHFAAGVYDGISVLVSW